ncbi:MAG: hypothetical protein ACJ8DC_16580 [Gemmatimonadales bacterium]
MLIRTAMLLALAAAAPDAIAQAPRTSHAPSCTPAERTDPQTVLQDAARALGMTAIHGRVLHFRMTEATLEDYQSDRTYPPFFLAFTTRESWYQPTTGVVRHASRYVFPFTALDFPVLLSGPKATFQVQDTATSPSPSAQGGALILRALDPWAQLNDWMGSDAVTVLGRCMVRDYPRTVLERNGPYGRERLVLDPKTGLPVLLEREEPHYLWGQVQVGYVYSSWKIEGGFAYPGSSFRMVDGAAEVSRTVSSAELVAPDSAPTLVLPDTAVAMPPSVPKFLRPTPPDSVRVSPATRLLVNPGYTEGVVLVGDTVYLLDATQGEERARADSALIARLFPEPHPLVLVVTDLAWPHVAGLRYWVARGATVVSHRASRPFLERVLQRRWTRAPDLYERRRKQARFVFKPVSDSLSLAGGRLRLYPIDGIGSEVALVAYVEGDRFLWSSDYIQTVQQPSTYLIEVWRAARRAGIEPQRTAAQHLPLTAWSIVDSLARAEVPEATP